MFSEINLKNCPEDFAYNCACYDTQCHNCLANGEGSKLYYQPISGNPSYSYKKHPAYLKPVKKVEVKVRDDKAAFYNRKGRQIEKKVIKSMGASSTMMSGATNGDGDGTIVIGGFKHRISHKFRFSIRNCLGPTSSEWEEGIRQGIDIWVTSSEVRGSVVTMSMETFNQLKEMANGNGG